MLAWMVYVVLLSGVLGVAALAVEHAALQQRTPTRWVWLVAMLLSVAMPMVITFISTPRPHSAMTVMAWQAPPAPHRVTSIALPHAINQLDQVDAVQGSHRDLNSWLRRGWGICSALLLAAWAFQAMLLSHHRREWRPGVLGQSPVWVAVDVGPAVVGLWRPRIVVPAWLLQASTAQQQYVVAHEQSHLDAHDPQWLSVALALLVVMPWNAPLWWLYSRLRRATEVDCDARVIARGNDAGSYCRTLIDVGQNQSRFAGAVIAMSGSGSFLEQRIRIMLRKRTKSATVQTIALLFFSLVATCLAAQITPPEPTAANAAISNVAIDGVGTDAPGDHAGYYEIAYLSVLTVRRDDDHLVVRASGQPVLETATSFYAGDADHFYTRNNRLGLQFIRDPGGHVAGVNVYQNGHPAFTGPRIDPSIASRINQARIARISEQKPLRGSEKGLQLILADPDDGAGMSPQLAGIRAIQKPQREKLLARLGPVASYKFIGVSDLGWDRYMVQHANGAEEIHLLIDTDGTVIGSYRRVFSD